LALRSFLSEPSLSISTPSCRRGLDNDFQTILDCGGQSRQRVRFNLIKPVFPADAV